MRPMVTAQSFLGGAVGAIKEGKSVLANSLPQIYNHETVFVLIEKVRGSNVKVPHLALQGVSTEFVLIENNDSYIQ